MNRTCRVGLLMIAVSGVGGCKTIAQTPGLIIQRVSDFVHCIDDDFQSHEEIKEAERQAIKEELNADRKANLACELAEINADRENLRTEQDYRVQALKAESDRRQDESRRQFDESVRTKLGLNLDQRVKVGQLQVDVDKLKQLVESRDKEHQLRMKLYEEARRDEELRQRMAYMQQLRGQQSALHGEPNSAAEGSCATTVNDCARPPQQLRDGPLRTSPLQAPLRQPVLSTEVPFMLPVSLEMAVEGDRLGTSEVRRQPLKQACVSTQPCGKCSSCRKKKGCEQPQPCGRCTQCAQMKNTAGNFMPAPPIPSEPELAPGRAAVADESQADDETPVRRR